jgi:Cu/Ag efflux protein CusF
MKKAAKTLLSILICFFALNFPVSAETLSGKVAEVDPATGKLTVEGPDSVDIWVNPGASMFGISSLADLKAGDTVSVDFETDSEGNKEASSVSKM